MRVTRLIFGILAILSLAALGSQWLAPMPFEYAAALNRNGAGTVNKFGQAVDVNGTEMTIWEGNATAYGGPDRAFANQSGAFTLYASSDNGADTMDFYVQGLDASWEEQTVMVTLTGTTVVPVGAASSWRRVFRARPGADLTGVVYLHLDATPTAGVPDTPATDIITIVNATENQTMMAAYTVPEGKAAMLNQWCVSNEGGGGADIKTFRLRTTSPQGTASRTQQIMTYSAGAGDCILVDPPIKFAAQSDIELTVKSAGTSGAQPVTGHFDFVLVDD